MSEGSMGTRPEAPSEAAVLAALATVVDPELAMSIVDLSLVYGVVIDGDRVRVTMTVTVPGCPIHQVLTEQARRAVEQLPGVRQVDLDVTFDPPWTPDRVRR
jgi:metal-sulfur cluster biosynthetic enzyme